MKEFDPFNAFVFPTVEFSKNNKHKSIRALGQITAVVPMLPWVVVAMCLLGMFWAILDVGIKIQEWWEKV